MESDDHGDFKVRLEMEENVENLDFLKEISDDFFIEEMIDPFSTINDAGGSENPEKLIAEMKRTLEDASSENTSIKRFKSVSEDEIKKFRDSRQTDSTKRNTKWGVKIIQEWSTETFGLEIDFVTIEAADLNSKLSKFYAEARPKITTENTQSEYHKNTMKNIRAAINRHLSDLERDMNIVKDKEFKSANDTLDGKLKHNVKCGISKPTKHKEVITPEDLMKIREYLYSVNNPVVLRYRVWYDIAIHFVTRGLEFHEQLKQNSFAFITDENEREYVVLSHETKQKTIQGGLTNEEANHDKRMYATNTEQCPVASLKLFLSKTDPNAKALFNHCKAEAINDLNENIWYSDRPVKKYQFSKFMSDISKNAKCKLRYTAHCLRATSIQALSDAGVELRHIMYMSGHRNEGSIRSYARNCTGNQKLEISRTLSNLASASNGDAGPSCLPDDQSYENTYLFHQQSMFKEQNTQLSKSFITNSVFNNCSINVNCNVQPDQE